MDSYGKDDRSKRFSVVGYEALDMDTPAPPTKQLVSFVLKQKAMPVSFIIGFIVCLATILYTRILSVNVLSCPNWAVDCNITTFIEWNAANIAVVQGIITICYGLGLAAMGYSARGLAESMIWPLLGDKHMSIEQIETYLSAAHGSIPLRRATVQLFKWTAESALIMVLTIVISLTPLSAGPLVGSVYARSAFPEILHSKYKVGAGIGRIFAQTTPPIAVGAEGMSSFLSWSKGLSREPLPEIRHWVVDRSLLVAIGNITVNAIFTKVDVDCHAFDANPTAFKNQLATYPTNMASHNLGGREWNSSSTVEVRTAKSLSVWIDDFTFNHPNKSTAVIVFSANNGTIEGGSSNTIASDDQKGYPTSTLSCTVSVEFIDSILHLGTNGPLYTPFANHTSPTNLTTLSSIAHTHISFKNSTTDNSRNTLNENALWFAVAPVLLSPSIGGAQPEYYKDTANANANNTWLGLPVPFTKGPYMTSAAIASDGLTADLHVSNDWSINDIHRFINVSIGAVAQASSRNFQQKDPILVASTTYTRRMDPERVKYLVFPMVFIVLGEIGLLVVMVMLYKRSGVPVMRMAGIGEVLSACRSELFWRGDLDGHRHGSIVESEDVGRKFGVGVGVGGSGLYDETGYDRMGRARVMFGWTRGAGGRWVAGLSEEVKKFKE